jgi:HopA1 effector protein family
MRTYTLAGSSELASGPEQIEEVARLVEFPHRSQPTFAGTGIPRHPDGLIASLAQHLYQAWYLRWSPAPAPRGPLRPYELDAAAALRVAHAQSESFEDGWIARRVSTHGRVQATKDGAARLLDRSDYIVAGRPGRRAEPGDRLRVAARNDYIDDVGFWITHLGGWPPAQPELLTRLYLHSGRFAIPLLVRELTRVLTGAGAPAALKTAAASADFDRADSIVVYFPKPAFVGLASELSSLAVEMSRHLVDPPPRLTLRLTVGVGIADGAPEGASFGESRCRLIAEALCDAGPATVEARVAAIRARFLTTGLDPDRPHLSGPEADDYGW